MRRLACVVAASLAIFASGGPAAVASECEGLLCDVRTDDSADAIRGELLIPKGGFRGDRAVRAEASDCPGCVWRLEADCADEGDSLCVGATATCPEGQIRYEIQLLRPEATEFVRVGSVCLGPGTPRTPRQASEQLRDRFVELLPALDPSFQPATGGLVNLPVIFASGQPTAFRADGIALGPFDVDLRATPTWRWEFGDGSVLETSSPGGAWPDDSVSHTYRDPGTLPVRLSTAWRGTFTLDGLGPFPIAGPPVGQDAALPVPIREARSRLLAD